MIASKADVHDYGLGLVDGDVVGRCPVLEAVKRVVEDDVVQKVITLYTTGNGNVVNIHLPDVSIRASYTRIRKQKGPISAPWDAAGEEGLNGRDGPSEACCLTKLTEEDCKP